MIFVKNVPYLGLISCPCKQQTCIQYTNVRLTARAPRHLLAELRERKQTFPSLEMRSGQHI